MNTIWFLAENCLILEMFLYYQSCRTLHSVFNQIEYFIVLITSAEKESNRFFSKLDKRVFHSVCQFRFFTTVQIRIFGPFHKLLSNLIQLMGWSMTTTMNTLYQLSNVSAYLLPHNVPIVLSFSLRSIGKLIHKTQIIG